MSIIGKKVKYKNFDSQKDYKEGVILDKIMCQEQVRTSASPEHGDVPKVVSIISITKYLIQNESNKIEVIYPYRVVSIID